jgi:hypothetical protein
LSNDISRAAAARLETELPERQSDRHRRDAGFMPASGNEHVALRRRYEVWKTMERGREQFVK